MDFRCDEHGLPTMYADGRCTVFHDRLPSCGPFGTRCGMLHTGQDVFEDLCLLARPECLPVGTCHSGCPLCWDDFERGMKSNHACACDECVGT